MHSTGFLIEDKCPFSEKNWGHRTSIYAKLAQDMMPPQWNRFYDGLRYTGGFHEKMQEFSRPAEEWTDDPNEYIIIESDPIEEEENGQEEGDKQEEGEC